MGSSAGDIPLLQTPVSFDPMLGKFYAYHIFLMMTIFGIVLLFLPFFDAMITKFLVAKSQKVRALMLGFAMIIAAIMVGDFSWFLMRQLLPLDSDAQGGSLMQSTDWMWQPEAPFRCPAAGSWRTGTSL